MHEDSGQRFVSISHENCNFCAVQRAATLLDSASPDQAARIRNGVAALQQTEYLATYIRNNQSHDVSPLHTAAGRVLGPTEPSAFQRAVDMLRDLTDVKKADERTMRDILLLAKRD